MEIWKEVRGYEDYEVSNLGRVKSLARIITTVRGSRSYKEKISKQTLGNRSYLVVSLSKNGKCKTRCIHQLVAESFLGHIPNGYKAIVDHVDNNPLNNNLNNLQIISQRENSSKDRKGSSKYTGVCWHKNNKKWKAGIKINGKTKNLGYFTGELKAAEAYQTALKELLCTK